MTDTNDETPTPDADTTPAPPPPAAPPPQGIRRPAPSFARTGKDRRLVF